MNASGTAVVRINPGRLAGSTGVCLRSPPLGVLLIGLLLLNLLGLLLSSPLPAAG